MLIESHSRSVMKAVSWRFFGSLATALLVFLFTRRLALSLGIGLIETVSKIGLYFVHERAWNRISFGKKEVQSAVLWFTGLSGSGKTTLAKAAHGELQRRGVRVEYLDGDSIRDIFPSTGFTRAERDMHIRRVGHLASTLEKNGIFVVASFISPYADSRDFVRGLCGRFVEIHVSTPLEICEKRDVKGLYAKARRGEIKDFTGIDSPYEAPKRPEIAVDAGTLTVEQSLARVMDYVDSKFLHQIA